MPDRDDLGHAWRVPPSEYLKRRPKTHAVPEPKSCYVPLRDGVRLAVDCYVPGEGSFPTVVILTPYYRRFAVSGPGAEPAPNVAKYRDFFVPRGYAMVAVDVRGTGASFGTRDAFRSPREREDHREIANWIVAQPWSSGVIGSTGISYLGAAACFLASTGHPAVKAIAPLFAVHDTYADHVFPGGIMCTTVTENYDDLVSALDLDQRDRLAPYAYFSDPRYAGPAPVDEDPDGALVRAAIEDHRHGYRLRDLAPELAFREDPTPHDPDLHSGACSPYYYLQNAKGKVAIYSISGWYDGSQFANGAISRFLTMQGPNDRLLLGPWDHGARANGSPFRDAPSAPQYSIDAEVLRFFDEHLMGRDTGLRDEAPVHYFTAHEEAWKSAHTWPPHARTATWHFGADGTLAPQAPATAAKVPYQVKFTTGTGRHSRFERLAAYAITDYYPDWHGRDHHLLNFTTAPFANGAELSGHAIVTLTVSTSERDGSVFVYLAEVEADGRCRYITEGSLRMLHRAEAPCPPTCRTTWPWRSYSRAAAKRMEPGVPDTLRFTLLPISWKLAPGSRLRLSIAGTDCDHFMQVPHGRPPRFEIGIGPAGSRIELPLVA